MGLTRVLSLPVRAEKNSSTGGRASKCASVFFGSHRAIRSFMERIWILGSIVLVAALVFIVCALAFIVTTRVLPLARAKGGRGSAKDALSAGAQ